MDVREKLVELLRNSPHLDTVKGYKGNDCTFEQGADWLIAHGVTVQEWISVDDRLPEQGERVLATDGGFVGELYVNSRCQWQRYNVNDHSLLMALDILWWMPLPQPPKGE